MIVNTSFNGIDRDRHLPEESSSPSLLIRIDSFIQNVSFVLTLLPFNRKVQQRF